MNQLPYSDLLIDLTNKLGLSIGAMQITVEYLKADWDRDEIIEYLEDALRRIRQKEIGNGSE